MRENSLSASLSPCLEIRPFMISLTVFLVRRGEVFFNLCSRKTCQRAAESPLFSRIRCAKRRFRLTFGKTVAKTKEQTLKKLNDRRLSR